MDHRVTMNGADGTFSAVAVIESCVTVEFAMMLVCTVAPIFITARDRRRDLRALLCQDRARRPLSV
jgi:hypothetical protein